MGGVWSKRHSASRPEPDGPGAGLLAPVAESNGADGRATKPKQAPENDRETDAAMAAEVEAVPAEFSGDARATITALLYDPDQLTANYAGRIGLSYVRGHSLSWGRGRAAARGAPTRQATQPGCCPRSANADSHACTCRRCGSP